MVLIKTLRELNLFLRHNLEREVAKQDFRGRIKEIELKHYSG